MNCDYCSEPAELVTGAVIYPHRPDLNGLKFWRCAPCGAYVGCHEAGSFRVVAGKKIVHTGIEPLGRLANAELRAAKQAAHKAFDPIWKCQYMKRKEAYTWLAEKLGMAVEHTYIGMFDVATCQRVVEVCAEWEPATRGMVSSCEN